LESLFSKENTEFYKSKIRKEIKSAIKKDRILSESDAKLINEFIKKLNKELTN
jgi:transcriptional regulator NrdR family protein